MAVGAFFWPPRLQGCGSDLDYIAAGGIAGPTDRPIPLGHELSGTVIAAGAEVTGVRCGERVIVNPLFNLIGNGGPEGGFADHLLIRDVVTNPASLLSLPAGLSLDMGALVEPLAVAMHAVNRLGAKAGDKVAVFGAGPIGLGTVAVLRSRGIDDVVVFDLSPFRRDRALALGACAAFDPTEKEPAEALRELHGSVTVFRSQAPQTTHYIEASGAPVLPGIIAMARAGASVCVVSSQKTPVPVDFQSVMTKELTFTGALGYSSELADVLAMLESGAVDPEPMISHRFRGEQVMAAFDMARSSGQAAKVLVQYDQ
jgi:(R,R)-butanediol dehydrogenase / meso-butanediol dehydrogenase / diacetyl reductase